VTRVPLRRRLGAEALGSAFLLATVIGSGIMAEKLAGGNAALALLCNTIPTGAILVVLILIFGPVSGAHLNPAVTLAFALRRELPWREAGGYAAAQIAGAVAGAGSRMRCSNCRSGRSRCTCAPGRGSGWERPSPPSDCC
jgi:glycerol uptake facilitator-like aquaporin